MGVMAVSTAWIGVIGALGGVIVTGVIGLVTALLNHRWQESERRQSRSERLSETRAELRRDAYVRFLVAAQTMGDHLLIQTPESGGDPFEAMRSMRAAEPKIFDEFDASERAMRLLGGERVIEELDRYREWFDNASRTAILSKNPLLEAFNGWPEAEGKLIEAMRREQEDDLTEKG